MPARTALATVALWLCLAAGWPLAAMAQALPAPADPTAAGAAASPVAAPGETVDQNYQLGPDDVLELEVLGRADFRTRAKIGSDGNILLPYLGAVPASNRTTRQLADEVTRALENGGFFSRPILRVEVVSYSSRYVTVLGAVGGPGLVPINKAYRLSEILARVGGVSAASADYLIVRPEKGPEQRYSLKALITGDVSQDPFVAPGDKIFVPIAETFYISGQVRAPGQFPLSSDLSLRMAIARAGGLTDLGSDRRVKINRQGKKVKGRIDLDAKVEAGDVIEIGERLF